MFRRAVYCNVLSFLGLRCLEGLFTAMQCAQLLQCDVDDSAHSIADECVCGAVVIFTIFFPYFEFLNCLKY